MLLDRLDFVLPQFVRLTWVSDAARDLWEPRLGAVARAWEAIEWLSVADDVRSCAVMVSDLEALLEHAGEWSTFGLRALTLDTADLPSKMARPDGSQPRHSVAVGRPDSVAAFLLAIETDDHLATARLIGTPPCCSAFLRRVTVEHELFDTTWAMAGDLEGDESVREVSGAPEANILWRWLGIRAVPHLPCRFSCPATAQLGARYVETGRAHSYGDEMDWLLEVLSWPAEWSALHGIAEVKTPVLKFTTSTDATATKYVVRWQGEAYPEQGAKGLGFPYVLNRAPVITSSRGYRRGLGNPIAVLDDTSRAAPRAYPSTMVEDDALNGLREFHGVDFGGLRIRDICTGDYFTAVVLSDGSQGVGTNLFNVHGPHRRAYNAEHFDGVLKALSKQEPLLAESFLGKHDLDSLSESVKLAVLNALSSTLRDSVRWEEHSLRVAEGVLDVAGRIRPGDTVGMIGCMGNYTCWEVGGIGTVGKVLFSDMEYVDGFKEGVAEFIATTFDHPDKVVISDGTSNRAICETSDVMIITSDTLCTNTFDQLLEWSRRAREVIVVGRGYAMDPRLLFARGVTAMTTQSIVHPDVVGFVRAKLASGEFGFTDSLVGCFQRVYVEPVKGATIQTPGQSIPISLGTTRRSARPASAAAVPIDAVPGNILEHALIDLERSGRLAGRRIESIALGDYFTVVGLDDGSVGAAMSYYRYPPAVLDVVEQRLLSTVTSEPLLAGSLSEGEIHRHDVPLLSDHEYLLLRSLKVALVSALSADLLARGGEGFASTSTPPPDLFGGARRAVVVGFGGFMETLATAVQVDALHVVDLLYGQRRAEMDAVIAGYRARYPEKEITISDGQDASARFHGADTVTISGSALANGTMEQLLEEVARAKCRHIVVQGQTASVHPAGFFARGVELVVTTVKPKSLLDVARAGRRGDALRTILEGALPSIYLSPT